MNISEVLQGLENTIVEAKKYKGGNTAIRINKMYIDVLFYLIEKRKVSMIDDAECFWKYIKNYSPPELYKVANYYRKNKGMESLNYEQEYYR